MGGSNNARIIWFMTRCDGKAELLRDLVRAPFAVDVFVAKPIGRAEKLARENIGLDFLAFARRIAFDPAGAAIDRIAAESVRAHRDLVVWIAVQAVVADLVCDDDQLLDRVLVLGDIDKPCETRLRKPRTPLLTMLPGS